MEIKEILSYYLNVETNILEVSFRTIEDGDESARTDFIDYSLIKEYGYEPESQDFDFFGISEDEDDFLLDNEVELDQEVLTSFLNEYYMVNPDSLPESAVY